MLIEEILGVKVNITEGAILDGKLLGWCEACCSITVLINAVRD